MENILPLSIQWYLRLSREHLSFCETQSVSHRAPDRDSDNRVNFTFFSQSESLLTMRDFSSSWFVLYFQDVLFWSRGHIPLTQTHAKYFCSFSTKYIPENTPSADPTAPSQKEKAEIRQNTLSGRQFLCHPVILCDQCPVHGTKMLACVFSTMLPETSGACQAPLG